MFELINVFEPDIPFQVLGGNDYQICIFERVECERQMADAVVPEHLPIKEDPTHKLIPLEYHDYEYAGDGSLHHSKGRVYSGSFSLRVNEDLEFVKGIQMPVKDLHLR